MTSKLTVIIEVLASILVPLFVDYRPSFITYIYIHTSKKKVLEKLYYVSKTFQEHFTSSLTPLLPSSEFLIPMLAAVLVMVGSGVVILILILEVPMQIPLPRHVLAMIILIWIFIMTFIPISLKAILKAKFKKELSKNSTSDEYRNLIDYSITSMGRYTILFQFLLLVFMVIIISINIPSYFLITFLGAAFEFALIGYVVYSFYEAEYYKPLDSLFANIFKDNFTNTHKHAIYIAVITKYGNHKEYKGRVLDIDKYLVIEDKEDRNKRRIPIDWHAIESIELVKEK